MALRILLADDSMTAQNMGKKILTDAGFDVVTVSNGAAAAKKLAEVTPDIAILDVYMPGYTGLELCERLKSAPITANVPVLLSVGKMEPFRPEDGMKVRADGVIIKPFEASDLVMVIDKLAERTYGAEAKGVAVAEPEEEEEQPQETFEEPAPLREATAEGLETFTPAPNTAEVVAPEPHVEFTSAPKVGAVSAPQAEDLLTTLVQPHDVEAAIPEIPIPVFEPTQFAAAEEEGTVQPVQEPVEELQEETAEQVQYSVTEEPVVEIIDDEELAGEAPAEVADETTVVAPILESAAVAQAYGYAEQGIAEQEQENSFEVVTEEPALIVPEEEANIEVVSDPALVAREEEAPLIPATAAFLEVEESRPAGWMAVESEVADDIDLELEAEMHDGVAVSQPTVAEPEIAAPILRAAPFLAPLGKTSFDELDAVMEQHAGQREIVAPVVAEEIPVIAPIGDPAEQEPVLTAQDEITVPIVSDEILGVHDIQSQATAMPKQPGRDEVAPVLEDAASADLGELLETDKNPLAFYGLTEDDSGDILRNPIEELDEPLFSVASELAPIPRVEASEEEPLLEEAPGEPADILESDSVLAPPVPQQVEVLSETEPDETSELAEVAEEQTDPAVVGPTQAEGIVEAGDGEGRIQPAAIEEALEPTPVEEIAAPEIAAQPPEVVEAAPLAVEETPGDQPTPDTEVDDSAASALAGVASAVPVGALAAAAAAEVKSTAEQVALAGEQPTLDETVATGMVGRVVDRVVDRLKPILTVMVEELLKEVKK